jgi:hypothetical protein
MEDRYFLFERDGVVVVLEYDDHDYQGLSCQPDTWFINRFFDDGFEAKEVADIINALVDDERGRMVLMKRLMRIV